MAEETQMEDVEGPALEDAGAGTDLEEEAERKLRDALARIDRVDDVQQRFLSEARRQVSELHLEAARARAAALASARKAVTEAEAEAASVLEAARQEAARLRAESEEAVKAHAEVLLAVTHKERDDLMAAASAAADRLREEAAVSGESLLNTAQAKAVRLVQEAKEEAARIRAESGVVPGRLAAEPAPAAEERLDPGARRAPSEEAQEAALRRLQDELRAMAERLAEGLDALVAQAGAAGRAPADRPGSSGLHAWPAPQAPEVAEPPAPAPAPAPPAPAPAAEAAPAMPAHGAAETPLPLVGSRGNRGASSSPPSAVAPAHARPEPEHEPGLHPQGAAWGHSGDWPRARRGRGWRYRGA